jgi:hypothetical protein
MAAQTTWASEALAVHHHAECAARGQPALAADFRKDED